MPRVSIESVDDLLVSQMTGTQPPAKTPEIQSDVSHETHAEPEAAVEAKVPTTGTHPDKPTNSGAQTNDYGDEAKEVPTKSEPEREDEYGLSAENVETETSKTYTKSEMDEYANRLIRERLARLERNSGQQFTQQQVQQQATQAQENFEYDENSNLDWRQQLKAFVKQTSIELAREQAAQVAAAEEQVLQAEFEKKFHESRIKFKDYNDVVGNQPITDAMVMGARGIKDPAAFFYAAAKRAPEELAKIAANRDPYAQAAAIGRLDERLRKQAQKVSNAPKPVHKTHADMTIGHESKEAREPTLDDLLLEDARKRQALLAQRRR